MLHDRKAIKKVLTEGDNFLVAAHYGPDGDAIGSTAALGHLLKKMGKNFALYNESGLPEPFAWLDTPSPILTELPQEDPDWFITLDCGDVNRLGTALRQRFNFERTINIDHHLGNPGFGSVNWVDPNYSSVGEMVADLAVALEIPLSGGLGEGVYLAIVTDTGYFSYENTHPRTLELCAEILRQGLDPASFNARLINQWSLNRLQLWSRVMGRVHMHLDGRMGVMTLTQRDFQETGTTTHDCDNMVNYVRRVKGVKVAASLRETENGQTKISLRSPGEVNVQVIAAQFDGGGHKNASGAMIHAPLEKAEAILVEAVAKSLEAQGL